MLAEAGPERERAREAWHGGRRAAKGEKREGENTQQRPFSTTTTTTDLNETKGSRQLNHRAQCERDDAVSIIQVTVPPTVRNPRVAVNGSQMQSACRPTDRTVEAISIPRRPRREERPGQSVQSASVAPETRGQTRRPTGPAGQLSDSPVRSECQEDMVNIFLRGWCEQRP